MKFWKRIFENRYTSAIFFAIILILLSLLFGAVFSLIGGTFWQMTKIMFWAFFAPGVVASLLLILTPISEDLSLGFGYGLYYGTAAAYTIISKFSWATDFAWIASFIFAALVCYIVYLKIDD